jgi:hypothetical protein
MAYVWLSYFRTFVCHLSGTESLSMKRITDFGTRMRVLLLCSFGLLPACLLGQNFQIAQFASDGNINSCAPSNNGTGHMVCIQLNGTSATGVAWVPGGFPGASPTTPGFEAAGTIDTPLPLGVPASTGTLGLDQASCVPANDGRGNVICVVAAENVVTQTNGGTPGSFLYGIAFNPVPPTSNSGWVLLGTGPRANTWDLSCAATAFQNDQAICTFFVGDQLEGVAFSPGTAATGPSTTGLVPLPYGSGFFDPNTFFVGPPSCTIGNQGGTATSANHGGTVAICAVVQNGNLVGFAFDPRTGYTSSPQTLIAGPFTSGPSCATPPNNSVSGNTGTSPQVICAIVGGGTIQAVAFDPVGGTQSSFNYGLPAAARFIGGITCAASNANAIIFDDVTGNIDVGAPQFQNTVDCATTATLTNGDAGLVAMEFDPRVGAANLSFAVDPNVPGMTFNSISPIGGCLRLNVDVNGFACGVEAVLATPPSTSIVQLGVFIGEQ